MATPPEPLRLFEPEVSGSATAGLRQHLVSVVETAPEGDAVSEVGTTTTAQGATPGEAADRVVLDRLTEAADRLDRADSELDEAIHTARAAGHSWRVIASAARRPHQTLHRRFAAGARRSPTS